MRLHCKWIQQLLLAAACLMCAVVQAEDIDIFAGTVKANTSLPSVVFVLDNTSNWSRSSQKWPEGVQGQSEVKAIRTALANQVGKLNVGIMEYTTSGSSATTDGAYVRFNLQELTAARLVQLNTVLDKIYADINDPTEKRSSSNPYGYLPNDYYNYLAGALQSKSGAGTPATLADALGYTNTWNQFKSPLTADAACAKTYMIFIGNNANGAVTGDDTTNSNNLRALYQALGETPPDALAGSSAGTPLKMPGFTTTTVTVPAQVVPAVTQPGPWIPPVVVSPAVPAVYHPAVHHDAVVKVVTQAYKAAVVVPPVMSAPVPISAATRDSKSCWKSSTLSGCPADENTTGGLCAGDAAGLGLCSCTVKGSGSGCSGGTNHYTVVRQAGTKPAAVITAGYTIPEVPEICGPCEDIPAYDEPAYTTPAQPEVIQAGTGVYGPDVIVTPAYTIPAYTTDVVSASGTYNTTGGRAYNFDDWSKFLYNYGVAATFTVDDEPVTQRIKVVTYAIDVFNAQQSADLSSVWYSAANNGGGRYFQAKSENQILAAINSALGDILAVNSSFAAVNLPLSATNRARVDNQVYVGMFRPAVGKSPRWLGNLKRYQLALFNNEPQLADTSLQQAINPRTGFATDCAASFWTHDTGNYWENLGVDPAPLSECNDLDFTSDPDWSPWSDSPDGPFVEKGGVAQMTREGPAAGARKLFTESGGALRNLASSDATAIGGTNVYNYLRGSAAGTNETMPSAGLRASIHGDVVHSRPLSIRYNADDIVIYYGSNDGLFRAVNPGTGAERWALLAPEHYGKLSRLYNDTPLVNFPNATPIPGYTYANKDYFFDGATGQFVHYDANGDVDKAYIYPTMRRGGRMVYGLDVSDPNADPTLLWKQGCPSLTSDTGCTSGFSDLGQTWSTPVGGYVAGYVDSQDAPKAVVIFGGGFDDCLNLDAAAYPTSACSSAKGKGIYLLDAATGAKLALLPTDQPVISEISPVDLNFDGTFDFAYAADVKGSLYRINFATMSNSDPNNSLTALPPASWTIVKIGSVSGNTRRFYNAPVAAVFQGTVFVTIGSGDRERPLETNYPYTESVMNRFYALVDKPYETFVPNASGPLAANETTTIDLDGNTMLHVTPSMDSTLKLQDYDGWYMDLPGRGEQVANPAAIAGGTVFFNTFQPGGASNGICERPLGVGKGYGVKLFGPKSTEGNEIEGGGMPIPPVIATLLIPPGLSPCDGANCPTPDPNACDSGECEIRTVCIGCEGFKPVEIIPDAPPIRRRLYYTEDIDRE